MIFVTLGTQDKSFERLLNTIQNEIEEENIKEEVIVQAGFTKYESKEMKIYDYLDEKTFQDYIQKCDILLTHGGVGSILSGLKKGKTVVAVPRLKKYNEHESNHQEQIVEEFEKQGYILAVKDLSKLKDILIKAKSFKPKPFKSNQKYFIKQLENYIENEKIIEL